MPVDFDDEDISDVVEEVNRPTSQLLPNRQVIEQQEQDFEEQMSEVEARLEMAQYYRLLLSEPLFDDPPTPEVADRVEDEIRGFVRSRMQVLVGVGEPKKVEQKVFTDAEVQALRTLAQPEVQEALKALAAKVLKKPTILEAKPLPKEKTKAEQPVLKEPILKRVGFKRRPQAPAPEQAPQPRPIQRGRQQKKRLETHVTDDGTEIVRDLTPQARPVGTVQPIPTPISREQIEANAAQSAAYQARVALNTLEQNLRGKG